MYRLLLGTASVPLPRRKNRSITWLLRRSGQIAEEPMPYTFKKIARTVKKWTVVLGVVAAAGIANVSTGRADEAQAKGLLKAMSDYLAAQNAISFDYDSNFEIVSTQQQKIG